MKHILITGHFSTQNNGDMAMITSYMENMAREHPQEAFSFCVHSATPGIDAERMKPFAIPRVVFKAKSWLPRLPESLFEKGLVLVRFFLLNAWLLCGYRGLGVRRGLADSFRDYLEADLVVDLSGDTITGDYGNVAVLESVYAICLGVFFKKPTVMLAQSLGPFAQDRVRKKALGVLNRCQAVVLRDQASIDFFLDHGGNADIVHCVPDTAFALDPVPLEEARRRVRAEEDLSLPDAYIAINVSIETLHRVPGKTLEEREARYKDLFLSIVQEAAERNRAVVLVPHVVWERRDDREAARILAEACRARGYTGVYNLQADYNCKELKAVIGNAECLIASRMHAMVAAVSMGVPVLGLSYSHKYDGVIGTPFGISDFILEIQRYGEDFEALRTAFRKAFVRLYAERASIRRTLETRRVRVQRDALRNVEIAYSFLADDAGTHEHRGAGRSE